MIPLAKDTHGEKYIRMKRNARRTHLYYGRILGFNMENGHFLIEFLDGTTISYLSRAFDYVSEEEFMMAKIMNS